MALRYHSIGANITPVWNRALVWQPQHALADDVHLNLIGTTIDGNSTAVQPHPGTVEFISGKSTTFPTDAVAAHQFRFEFLGITLKISATSLKMEVAAPGVAPDRFSWETLCAVSLNARSRMV
ncbi:uncharacterized protein METZ01_LOCUS300400 [marine metagenome]|uniref:Uncharacterized protein n=1 Tax=marine metagenome TaxID=408172 RepID=A0A382MFN0_9ZZZZ